MGGWHQRKAILIAVDSPSHKKRENDRWRSFNFASFALDARLPLSSLIAHNMESPSPKRRRSDVSMKSSEGQSSPTQEDYDSRIQQHLTAQGKIFNLTDHINESNWRSDVGLACFSITVAWGSLVIDYCIKSGVPLKPKLNRQYATQSQLQADLQRYLKLESKKQDALFNHFYSTIGKGRGEAERKWLEFLDHRESPSHSLRPSS